MKMKKLVLLAVALVPLLSGEAVAMDRDGRHGRDFDRHDRGAVQYGHGHRDNYFVPAWARAVADGWIIGSKPEPGGFAIYRWNGYRWDEVHGAGIRIGGSYARPWHINDRGHRYVWNGWEWQRDDRHSDLPVFQHERSLRPIEKFRRDLRRGYPRDRW
ncbi:MAG: hypothetical protein RL120_01125 [Gammaproteobacteria bacterium]